jgi:hypothetical protein
MAEKEVVETSEAQIAVHWQEEELVYPVPEFIAQANMTDPARSTIASAWTISQLFQGIRRPAGLVRILAHHPGHQRRPLLEMVQGRQDQRLLQLRRPPPGQKQKQDGDPFRPELEEEGRAHHLPGALRAGQRDGRPAAGYCRPEGRRPGDPAPAHDTRAAHHHAGLRPPGRDPLPGVRRFQRQGLRPTGSWTPAAGS